MEESASIQWEIINVAVRVVQQVKTVNPLQVLVVKKKHVVTTDNVQTTIISQSVTVTKDTLERTAL